MKELQVGLWCLQAVIFAAWIITFARLMRAQRKVCKKKLGRGDCE